jgi:hypothetical protein
MAWSLKAEPRSLPAAIAFVLLCLDASALSAQTDGFRVGVNYTAAWKNGSTSRLYFNDANEVGANTVYLSSWEIGSVHAVKAAIDSAGRSGSRGQSERCECRQSL